MPEYIQTESTSAVTKTVVIHVAIQSFNWSAKVLLIPEAWFPRLVQRCFDNRDMN